MRILTFSVMAFGLLVVVSAERVTAQGPSRVREKIEIHSSPELLPVGAVCRIEMISKETGRWQSSTTFYEGRVAETTDHDLRLVVSRIEGRHRTDLPPILNAIPAVSRLYKTSGTAAKVPPAGQEHIRLHAKDIFTIKVVSLPEPAEGQAEEGVTPVGYEETEPGPGDSHHDVVIFANPSILPPGAVCDFEPIPKAGAEPGMVSGRIISAGADGMTLAVTGRESYGKPVEPSLGQRIASSVPFLGRRFVSSSVVLKEPVESREELRLGVSEIGTVWVRTPDAVRGAVGGQGGVEPQATAE